MLSPGLRLLTLLTPTGGLLLLTPPQRQATTAPSERGNLSSVRAAGWTA